MAIEHIRLYSRQLYIYRDKLRGLSIGATDLVTLSVKTGIPLGRLKYWFHEKRYEYFENDEIQITVVMGQMIFNRNKR